MRKINAVLTICLGTVAALFWGFMVVRAWQLWTTPPFLTTAAILITACAGLGWVLLTLSDVRREGECRCRKCGHILRGLSEPRMP